MRSVTSNLVRCECVFSIKNNDDTFATTFVCPYDN